MATDAFTSCCEVKAGKSIRKRPVDPDTSRSAPKENHGNDRWAMDFMSDKLFNDRPFRILTIVDCDTRKALTTVARANFQAYQVVDELDRLARLRGKPRSIRVDNGPEFADRMLAQ